MQILNKLSGSPLAVIVFVAWVAGVTALEIFKPEIDRGQIEKISGTAALMILILMKGKHDDAAVKEAKVERAEDRNALEVNTEMTAEIRSVMPAPMKFSDATRSYTPDTKG